MRMHKVSTSKGFSLIELVIVVSIIGVLSAIALPAYQNYAVKVRVAEIQRFALALTIEQDAVYEERGSFYGENTAERATVAFDGRGFDKYHFWNVNGESGLIEIYITEDLYNGANAGARFIYQGIADDFGHVTWNCVQHYIASLRPNDLTHIPEDCHDVMVKS